MHKKQHPSLGAEGVLGAGTSVVLADVGGSPPALDEGASSIGAVASPDGADGVPMSAVTRNWTPHLLLSSQMMANAHAMSCSLDSEGI